MVTAELMAISEPWALRARGGFSRGSGRGHSPAGFLRYFRCGRMANCDVMFNNMMRHLALPQVLYLNLLYCCSAVLCARKTITMCCTNTWRVSVLLVVLRIIIYIYEALSMPSSTHRSHKSTPYERIMSKLRPYIAPPAHKKPSCTFVDLLLIFNGTW